MFKLALIMLLKCMYSNYSSQVFVSVFFSEYGTALSSPMVVMVTVMGWRVVVAVVSRLMMVTYM